MQLVFHYWAPISLAPGILIPRFPGIKMPSFPEKRKNESKTTFHQMRCETVTIARVNGNFWSVNASDSTMPLCTQCCSLQNSLLSSLHRRSWLTTRYYKSDMNGPCRRCLQQQHCTVTTDSVQEIADCRVIMVEMIVFTRGGKRGRCGTSISGICCPYHRRASCVEAERAYSAAGELCTKLHSLLTTDIKACALCTVM